MSGDRFARISIIEPAWNGVVHLPANLGLINIARHAYPSAHITFVGGQLHIDALVNAGATDLIASISFVTCTPALDDDTLPDDVYRRMRTFKALPTEYIDGASLLIFCSCTATVLAALNFMGLAGKSVAYLHGNANEIGGWRSRNPIRRLFDLQSALKSFCAKGGRLLVYEDRINSSLRESYPWMSGQLFTLGHPIMENESVMVSPRKVLGPVIKIGFPGLATMAKGFDKFILLADELRRVAPGRFEFYAIGKLHDECKAIDQSSLVLRSDAGLPRSEFVRMLARMDFLFIWHSDAYYSNAASGVVYDAINLTIPLIARRSALMDELTKEGRSVGLLGVDLDDVIHSLLDRDLLHAM